MTISEAGLLESYSRRDNLRIVGLKEVRDSDKELKENFDQSMQNIIQISEKVEAEKSPVRHLYRIQVA